MTPEETKFKEEYEALCKKHGMAIVPRLTPSLAIAKIEEPVSAPPGPPRGA